VLLDAGPDYATVDLTPVTCIMPAEYASDWRRST
jgi:hypothetical protein